MKPLPSAEGTQNRARIGACDYHGGGRNATMTFAIRTFAIQTFAIPHA